MSSVSTKAFRATIKAPYRNLELFTHALHWSVTPFVREYYYQTMQHPQYFFVGLQKDTDMRGTFLNLALNTAYDTKSVDLLTGLRAQTKHGNPSFIQFFSHILKL